MQNKFKKAKVFIVAFLFVAMLTGSGWLLFLFFRDSEPSFNSLIDQADEYIASGYFDLAKSVLDKAYFLADADYHHLMTLKRMYQISKITDDWKYLQEHSLISLDKMPGNKSIIHFAVYSSLRSGDISKTWEILTTSGNISDFGGLWAEVNLKYDVSSDELIDEDKPILSLLLENDPEIFIEYGVLEDEGRLLLDAALLYMIEGRPDKALNIFKNIPENEYFELKSFIAYDAQNIELAIEILNNVYNELFSNHRLDLIVFLSDLYLISGEYEQSLDLYRQVFNRNTELAANSYLNSAWILQKQNKYEEAKDLLESGFNLFLNDFRFLKELVLINLNMENREEVNEIIDHYLADNPDKLNAQALKISLINKALDINYYEAKVWQLYEDYPANEDLCRYIVWYLINIDNTSDAQLALDIFDSANGGGYRAAWYLSIKGIVQGLSGNIRDAIEYLGESLEIEENSNARYNRAVLYLFDNKPHLAILDLIKIDTENLYNELYLSMVHYLLAEVYYVDGNIDKAIEECNYSLQINPDNNKSRLLLKKLKI